jgi:hypothetical protein
MGWASFWAAFLQTHLVTLRVMNAVHMYIGDWRSTIANSLEAWGRFWTLRVRTGLPDFSLPNKPKWAKIYQICHKMIKWLQYIPKGRRKCQFFSFQGPTTFTKIRILGLCMYNSCKPRYAQICIYTVCKNNNCVVVQWLSFSTFSIGN